MDAASDRSRITPAGGGREEEGRTTTGWTKEGPTALNSPAAAAAAEWFINSTQAVERQGVQSLSLLRQASKHMRTDERVQRTCSRIRWIRLTVSGLLINSDWSNVRRVTISYDSHDSYPMSYSGCIYPCIIYIWLISATRSVTFRVW